MRRRFGGFIPAALVTTSGLFATHVLMAQPGAVSHVTSRSIKTIGYWVDGGSTTVNLNSTGLLPRVCGTARVKATPGLTTIRAEVESLPPPARLGTEFLAYVLWALSPEWRAINLGSFQPDHKGRSKLEAATHLSSFALIVTAEPYGSVRQPSEMVVLENDLRKGTKRKSVTVEQYQLIRRGTYEPLVSTEVSTVGKNVPLEVYQARHAVKLAKSCSADRYAGSMMAKARLRLTLAEKALRLKASRNEIVALARQAAELAEDARILSVERQEQERQAGAPAPKVAATPGGRK